MYSGNYFNKKVSHLSSLGPILAGDRGSTSSNISAGPKIIIKKEHFTEAKLGTYKQQDLLGYVESQIV